MAKRDDKGDQPTRRVYKASDVHRRRVGDSSRSKPAKMPSRREARESSRESTRISAEARAGKVEKPAEPEVLENVDGTETVGAMSSAPAEETLESAGAKREESPKPRFTVIRNVRPTADEPAPDSADEPGAEPAANAEEPGQQRADEATLPRRRLATEAAGKAPRVRPRTMLIVAVAVLAVVAIALFAFNRWGRYDDHADLQGTWYILGSDASITIDESSIRFNEEVSYQYEIDPREKTIAYTFGPMSGQGRYWFSDDRKHLVITDGEGYTAAGTTVDDLIHSFLDFSTATGGGVVELPQGEGIIAFSRTPEKIITNTPAEGIYEPASGEAQPTDAGATAPAEGAAQGETTDETALEGAHQDNGGSEEGALDETHEQPTNEQEAA